MSVWFISDPHFGHKNIITYEQRPFLDTEEMDNVIIENYNRTVGENDIVFWLGDMFFCNAVRMEYISQRLSKGRKILIRGNHDKGVSNTKFKHLGFMPYRMYLYAGVMLTHEPLSETNMRILTINGISYKNIHGHVHSRIEEFNPSIYQCASVENINYTPISFLDLSRRFYDQKVFDEWYMKQDKN